MGGGAIDLEMDSKPKLTDRAPVPNAAPADSAAPGRGIMLDRFFTTAGVDPYSEVEWDLRSAVISGEDGRVVFEQKDVEVPRGWSQTATNVVVSKYFRGPLGTPRRETSVRQLISRVVDTITGWGEKQGYFAGADSRETFHAELKYLLLNQKASFNSPVYFNVGIEAKPQCSACFILKVDDSMDSILSWYRNEGMIFKGGSGAGVNLSALRSCREKLSSGGTASGPLSFMKAADASAGVIKSGGKTRRAAKMVVLNADHPDIVDFIKCKVEEEKKAWALIEAGYDSSLDGPAYGSVFFQNANNSVRATDGFMQAVLDDADWQTHFVRSGEVAETRSARKVLHMIAEATHACGDPGMQFDTTINLWHTCPASGRINASNPCSEYMHLDNSACNLASLNLMKFIDDRGEFDVRAFRHAVDVMITAQDIVVDNSSYPTDEIARNASAYRELGLGYANLGALLMALGMPYDSDQGRSYAAAITALMTGEAYLQSARIAEQMGPFAGYATNREPMLKVIERHKAAAYKLDPSYVPLDLLRAARESWDDALKLGSCAGYRNSQATVIAPTGTIAFMMDCDTTGIEPDLALVKYKKLVGGGLIKIVNNVVPTALLKLGYTPPQAADIVNYIDQHGTIEGAPGLKPEHLPVFDCSLKPANGKRSIHYMGHVRMMAVVQPFLSGAISKTVNMPEESTPEEIANAYTEGWRLGLKSIAIYRDGSKRSQPLNTSDAKPQEQDPGSSIQDSGDRRHEAEGAQERTASPEPPAPGPALVASTPKPYRHKLPDERRAITHKFSVGAHEGYLTVGLYEGGQPGEIFITMAKEGSTVSGLMDSFATAVSLALQYGVPLKVLCDKFSHMRFEPSGWTNNPKIHYAKSIMDYIFRWMACKFLPKDAQPQEDASVASLNGTEVEKAAGLATQFTQAAGGIAGAEMGQPGLAGVEHSEDAPSCSDCGAIMVRNGSCYRCMNCGSTSGCS